MTMQDDPRIFLEDLCKRWRQDADQILDLAISGTVPLWIAFSDVFVQMAEKPGNSARKKKRPAPQLQSRVEVKPLPEILMQVKGRCHRMLIAAELACADAKNKPVTVTNSVGEEWGETSMIGLNPISLFARMDDIARYERQNNITPPDMPGHRPEPQGSAHRQTSPLNHREHPCFAEELHIAVECWQTLFAGAQETDAAGRKAEILPWIKENHPGLSQTAAERIARVVAPAKKKAAS